MFNCYVHYFWRLFSQPFLLRVNWPFQFIGREQLSIFVKAKVRVSKEVLILAGNGYLEHFGRKDSGPKSGF